MNLPALLQELHRRTFTAEGNPVCTVCYGQWPCKTIQLVAEFHKTRGQGPPDGWYEFGTHAPWKNSPPLEFWGEDEGGMPRWERPVRTDIPWCASTECDTCIPETGELNCAVGTCSQCTEWAEIVIKERRGPW